MNIKIFKIILFILLTVSTIMMSLLYFQSKKQCKFQQHQICQLDSALQKALGQTAISFSIAPNITNKVTSAFGSTKNVSLQYFFTLDGKAIIAKPDSVYQIAKEYP